MCAFAKLIVIDRSVKRFCHHERDRTRESIISYGSMLPPTPPSPLPKREIVYDKAASASSTMQHSKLWGASMSNRRHIPMSACFSLVVRLARSIEVGWRSEWGREGRTLNDNYQHLPSLALYCVFHTNWVCSTASFQHRLCLPLLSLSIRCACFRFFSQPLRYSFVLILITYTMSVLLCSRLSVSLQWWRASMQ